ncbi:hypothetical protein DNK08_02030 [Stutzerimonas kirkiae]|nr:hypothetical protein DNK08_02030 [Stutzerimonas kirkiae]
MPVSQARVDPVTREAIDWLLRLDAGYARAGERQAFNAWLDSDPQHMDAWRRVSGLLQEPLAELQNAEAHSPGQMEAASRLLSASWRGSLRRRLFYLGLAALAVFAGLFGLLRS